MKTRRCRKDGIIRLGNAYRRRLEHLIARNDVTARVRVRAQILLLSDLGWGRDAIVDAAGTSTSTISRVRHQYIKEGLEIALSERSRPGGQKKLSDRAVQQIVAIACSEPPTGYARWSVRLLTQEVERRGISEVPIGRECIRVLLRDHDLKPWREKNVVRSRAD
jgi:putative transposase